MYEVLLSPAVPCMLVITLENIQCARGYLNSPRNLALYAREC